MFLILLLFYHIYGFYVQIL